VLVGKVTVFHEDRGKPRVHALADAVETAGADIGGSSARDLRVVGNDGDGVTFVSACATNEVPERASIEIDVTG
jgi:hypothetical protein